MRAVKGAVWLDITNPMEGFKITEIKGMVYKNGVPFVSGAANDVRIPLGTTRADVSGRAALCEGISIWDVLALVAFDPDDFSVDLSLRITMDSGETRVVSKKKLPVRTLLKLI